MNRVFPLLLLVIILAACSKTPAATGPTLEDGAPFKETEIEFEESSDIDYRAQGPFSEGPEAPPNVPL